LAQATKIRTVRRVLLRLYRSGHRDLPWRRRTDAYAVWVSEIMLQQTQVDTVVPRYTAFMERFPTLAALAQASEHAVCAAWAGLGYYRRARHLHRAAQVVVADHGGVVPRTVEALLALPGVGRYTAGAIASIAYGTVAPVVDGNVERVLSRLYALEAAPRSPQGKKHLWALATALVCPQAPGELNQSLMEFGALVCRPTQPHCARCPLQRHCAAYALGTPQRFPTKVQKTARQKLCIAFAYAADARGTWLHRRGLDGLWAGLWEPPSAAGEGAATALSQQLQVPLGQPIASVQHTLTHRDVHASLYRVDCTHWRATDTLRPFAAPLQAPLSTLAKKALLAAQASQESRAP
jgi:A/G-specific adenine glycosylase